MSLDYKKQDNDNQNTPYDFDENDPMFGMPKLLMGTEQQDYNKYLQNQQGLQNINQNGNVGGDKNGGMSMSAAAGIAGIASAAADDIYAVYKQSQQNKNERAAIMGSVNDYSPIHSNNVLAQSANWSGIQKPQGFSGGDAAMDFLTRSGKGAMAGSALGPWGMLGGAIGGGVASITKSVVAGVGASRAKETYGRAVRQDIGNFYDQAGVNNQRDKRLEMYNVFAEGGELQGLNGVTQFGTGGSHESNPFGGIPQGIASDGQPNLVEEGEVRYDFDDGGYIFSNRNGLSKKYLEQHHLPTKYAGHTAAYIATKLQKESEESPNDPLTLNTLKTNMTRLRDAQEAYNVAKQQRTAVKAFKQLPPEQQMRILGQSQEQPIGIDAMRQEQPMFAFGGHLFKDGDKPTWITSMPDRVPVTITNDFTKGHWDKNNMSDWHTSNDAAYRELIDTWSQAYLNGDKSRAYVRTDDDGVDSIYLNEVPIEDFIEGMKGTTAWKTTTDRLKNDREFTRVFLQSIIDSKDTHAMAKAAAKKLLKSDGSLIDNYDYDTHLRKLREENPGDFWKSPTGYQRQQVYRIDAGDGNYYYGRGNDRYTADNLPEWMSKQDVKPEIIDGMDVYTYKPERVTKTYFRDENGLIDYPEGTNADFDVTANGEDGRNWLQHHDQYTLGNKEVGVEIDPDTGKIIDKQFVDYTAPASVEEAPAEKEGATGKFSPWTQAPMVAGLAQIAAGLMPADYGLANDLQRNAGQLRHYGAPHIGGYERYNPVNQESMRNAAIGQNMGMRAIISNTADRNAQLAGLAAMQPQEQASMYTAAAQAEAANQIRRNEVDKFNFGIDRSNLNADLHAMQTNAAIDKERVTALNLAAQARDTARETRRHELLGGIDSLAQNLGAYGKYKDSQMMTAGYLNSLEQNDKTAFFDNLFLQNWLNQPVSFKRKSKTENE